MFFLINIVGHLVRGIGSYLDLLKKVNSDFLPDLDFLVIKPYLVEISEFFRNLKGGEKTTYYLCKNYTCGLPTTEPKELKF